MHRSQRAGALPESSYRMPIPILASLSIFWYTNFRMQINKAPLQMKNLDVAKLKQMYKGS